MARGGVLAWIARNGDRIVRKWQLTDAKPLSISFSSLVLQCKTDEADLGHSLHADRLSHRRFHSKLYQN